MKLSSAAIKFIALILCVATAIPFAVSCKGNGGDVTNPDAETTTSAEVEDPVETGFAVKLSEYTVIRSAKASSLVFDASVKLKDAIEEYEGDTLAIRDDWIKNVADIPDDACEILVGTTNRPESENAAKSVKESTFSITMDGNRIIIVASNDILVGYAVDYFINSFLNGKRGDGVFYIPQDLNYLSAGHRSIDISASGTALYYVMYPANPTTAAKKGYDKLVSELSDLAGANVLSRSDMLSDSGVYNPVAKEILVGDTAQTYSEKALGYMKPNQYGIVVIDNKICVVGRTRETTVLAIDLFLTLVKAGTTTNSSGKTTLSLIYSEPIIMDCDEYFYDVPEFNAGKLLDAYDCGDSSLAAYYSETKKSDFDAYCKAAEENGFTLYSSHTAASNSFATYTSDKGQIYVAFNEEHGETRIVTEKANYLAPVKSEAYTSKIEPAMMLLDISYTTDNTNGLGVIFRLSDGSFIVIDGGFAADSETVYNALTELSADKNSIPVIRMWLLTHMHGDHIQAFKSFAKNHAKDVKLEYVVLNCASAYYDAEDATDYTNGTIKSLVTEFSGARLIKIHEGTVLHFADAEIEILQTHEGVYPANMAFTHANDTSVVSRVKLGGQTILLPGDAQIPAGDAVCRTYGDYLKSDFVQVSHHGSKKWPTCVEFYKFAKAKYALFPGSSSRFDELKSTDVNKYIISTVGFNNMYVADSGNKLFELPYTK